MIAVRIKPLKIKLKIVARVALGVSVFIWSLTKRKNMFHNGMIATVTTQDMTACKKVQMTYSGLVTNAIPAWSDASGKL